MQAHSGSPSMPLRPAAGRPDSNAIVSPFQAQARSLQQLWGTTDSVVSTAVPPAATALTACTGPRPLLPRPPTASLQQYEPDLELASEALPAGGPAMSNTMESPAPLRLPDPAAMSSLGAPYNTTGGTPASPVAAAPLPRGKLPG